MGNAPLPTHDTWTKGDERLKAPAVQGQILLKFRSYNCADCRALCIYHCRVTFHGGGARHGAAGRVEGDRASILYIKNRVRANNFLESCLGRAHVIPARRGTRHEVNTFIIRLQQFLCWRSPHPHSRSWRLYSHAPTLSNRKLMI